MRWLLPLLLVTVLRATGPDAQELVNESLELYKQSWKATREYGFKERVRKIDLDSEGNEKKLDVKAFRVLFLEGSHYRRLISRFDKQLEPEEERSEQIKFEHAAASRGRESEKQREQRIRKFDKRRDQNSEAVLEIPRAFTFRLIGEEKVHGRPAYVIECRPRAGYRPSSYRARVFTHLEGKLWIDRETKAWLRAEAELKDAVTFGFFLVRLHKGAKAVVENAQTEDGIWATSRLWYRASLRVGLVKRIQMDQEYTYSEYAKDQTEASRADRQSTGPRSAVVSGPGMDVEASRAHHPSVNRRSLAVINAGVGRGY